MLDISVPLSLRWRYQARERPREGESSSSVAMPDRFGRNVVLVIAVDIKAISFNEILIKNEKKDSTKHLKFLRRLVLG